MSEHDDMLPILRWLQDGIDNGWCTPVVCATHDGLGLYSDDEMDDDDLDTCVHVVRLLVEE